MSGTHLKSLLVKLVLAATQGIFWLLEKREELEAELNWCRKQGIIMPRATVAKTTEKYDLKSVEGGFVEIRRMTYGEKLSRQDDLMQTSMKDGAMLMSMDFKSAALKDFGSLIVSHNLTDENDKLLNFTNAADVVALDPRIGEEIGTLIDELNAWDSPKNEVSLKN